MSAVIKIKQEDLVKGAIKIIRDKGEYELSARNLAKTVGYLEYLRIWTI